MSKINYQANPEGNCEVEWIPVFELFARRLANTEFEPLQPTDVGTTRLGDLETLPPPSSNTRLEIERTAGMEEIRWIDTTNGTYRSAVGEVARRIITDWDEQERKLFADADPDPEEFQLEKPGMMQRDTPYYRCIVEYDDEGNRDMPLCRKAGEVKDAVEFWEKADEPYSWIFIGVETAFCNYVRTGEYWVASGKELVDKIKERPSSCNLDSPGE